MSRTLKIPRLFGQSVSLAVFHPLAEDMYWNQQFVGLTTRYFEIRRKLNTYNLQSLHCWIENTLQFPSGFRLVLALTILGWQGLTGQAAFAPYSLAASHPRQPEWSNFTSSQCPSHCLPAETASNFTIDSLEMLSPVFPLVIVTVAKKRQIWQ